MSRSLRMSDRLYIKLNFYFFRADEVERAGALYSAFSKYLGGLSPSAGLKQPSLRV